MTTPPPILIVDDSEDDVELFCLGLSELGMPNAIDVCRDGVEALDYLLRRGAYSDRPPVLPLFVLADLKMPRMDGLELLGEIRRTESLRLLPVILMTSSNQPRDVMAGYTGGANAFVVKPVGFEQLTASAKAIGTFWGQFNRPPLNTPAA